MSHPGEVLVLPDASAIAEAAADRVCGWASEATRERGVAHVALTGGSSAIGLYRALRAPERERALAWGHVHLWWGDERFVPLDHPESNAGIAFELLLGQGENDAVAEAIVLPIPAGQVHPILPGDETDPAQAARAYAEALASTIGRRVDSVPIFDLILLGMGPDAHVLSVFPGSPALADDAPLAMAVPAPAHIGPHLPRITLSPRLLDVADHVLLMVAGAAKADAVASVFWGVRDPSRWPAQLALRPNATWLLDVESARGVPATS
jgi:6-phosphogluconolactonase